MTRPGRGPYPLVSKLLLALASIAAYALIADLAESVEALESVPEPALWFHYVAGAVFGALVLAPYVGPRRRMLRIVGLCVASAAIYRLAVWFVTEGPLDYDMLVTFAVAGAGAAILCGLAVTCIAPRPYGPVVFVATLAGGAIGGASFEFKIATDQFLLVSHAIWQLLACLALHAGFRDRWPA